MDTNSFGDSRRYIAVVAKYPFYAEDIRSELVGLDIEIVSLINTSQIQEHIEKGIGFEFIFFPHYSKIISKSFLKEYQCIGFHTGDLPGDRGGSPIHHKILKREYDTSVSALKLVYEIDAGDILCCESISLQHGSIEDILRKISKLIARMIKKILTEKLTPIPQSGLAQTSQRLNSRESELNLAALELTEIYDRIRMLDGLDYPSAHIVVGPYKISLSNAQFQDGKLTFRSQLEEK